MALIDLKSDLSKFRSDFQTPTLENKVNASKYNIDSLPEFKTPILVNKINASKYNIDELPKKFGANGAKPSKLDAFNYKKEIAMNNSKFAIGTATLSNQLGTGSPFKYLKDGALTSKIFSKKGYSSTNTYNSVVASISDQPNKSLLYKKGTEQNSPSAIDAEYKKYSLRDDAYNPTYMRHPLIVRGIQRKGNEKPQYWGFGSKSGFDDGLIRGGVVTVADRIVADTVRIAKFMASPKGLLWIVKQIGLGLTNPKVETLTGSGPFGRLTRIHTGVASLLSVPGTALGLHFTRHGIPFANEFASYENVIKGNIFINPSYSRLNDLKYGYGTAISQTIFEKVANTAKIIKSKTPISQLSGLAGPQSVYGIGFTQIRRWVDTVTDAEANAKAHGNWIQLYTSTRQYKSRDSKSPEKSSIEIQNNFKDVDVEDYGTPTPPVYSEETQLNKRRVSLVNKITPTPFKDTAGVEIDISTTATRKTTTAAVSTGIDNYLTLAYSKIPKNKGESSFRDFRNDITAETTQEKSILGTGTNKDYYKNNNLVTKYGFGTPGAVGADRTNPLDYILPGDKYTGDKKERTKLISVANFRGDKVNAYDIGDAEKKDVYVKGAEDFIKFYFEDGDIGKDVMVFRCTMNGFSDSFSPGWNRVDIMGRPDGAYLYTSFERSVSFNFTVAALSRAEMVPMWRKLNYLASYTMPDFSSSGTKPGGPFMRITIGNLFQQTPGFIESLTYTIPDETTWDIAEDSGTNPNAKQLPLSMEVQMTFKIIGDYRPQLKGRVYSLSPFGASQTAGNWLTDAEPTAKSKAKKSKIAKTEADKPKEK